MPIVPTVRGYSGSFSSKSSASKNTTSKTKSTNTKSSYVPDSLGTGALGFAGGYVLGSALNSHSTIPSLTEESVQIAKENGATCEHPSVFSLLLMVVVLVGGWWLVYWILDRLSRN